MNRRVLSSLGERTAAAGRDYVASGYASAVRAARPVAVKTGLLSALDRRCDRDWALFARSLFAVHDIEDMSRLDLPWWVMEATKRVDAFLATYGGRARAFEYGGGASTLWLARRCSRVITVEHDPAWSAILARQLDGIDNVQLKLVPPRPAIGARYTSDRAGWRGMDFANYARAIRAADGPFELVLIDGRARAACLSEALPKLAERGLLVFDNSDRSGYRRAIRESGLAVQRFRGFAPCVPWPSETSLLAERACLGSF